MDDNPFLRVTPSSPHRWYFRYQHLYAPLVYMLFSPFTIFVYDFAFFFRDRLANMDLRHDLRRLRVMAIVGAEKAAYLTLMLVVPLLVLDQPWWAVVLGFALMQCAASLAFTLPLVSTHIAEEVAFPEADGAGYVEGCWATHQLATSMDYSPESRLANWLLGAVNAHAAHHLFPDVCHVHYVALSKIIRETAREHGVRYHAMPFPAALRSHFRHLKRMGEDPTPLPVTRRSIAIVREAGSGTRTERPIQSEKDRRPRRGIRFLGHRRLIRSHSRRKLLSFLSTSESRRSTSERRRSTRRAFSSPPSIRFVPCVSIALASISNFRSNSARRPSVPLSSTGTRGVSAGPRSPGGFRRRGRSCPRRPISCSWSRPSELEYLCVGRLDQVESPQRGDSET